MRRLFLILLLALPACTTAPAQPSTTQPAADRLPDGWNISEIASAAMTDKQPPHRIIQAKILLWEIHWDGSAPSTYRENCFVWVRYALPDGDNHWCLARMFRHPKVEQKWRVCDCDIPFDYLDVEYYNHPPTRQDIVNQLAERWHNIVRERHLYILEDYNSCPNAWRETTSQDPPDMYR